MSGILSRLMTAFQAQAYETVERIEDPRASLEYSLLKLEENRRELSRSLIEVSASRGRLDAQRSRMQANIDRYRDQAERALQSGREDLARSLIQRKQEAQERLKEVETNLATLATQVENLKESQLRLDRKITLFRAKKEELKSLYDASQVQLRLRETFSGVSHDLADAGQTIQRIEERIQAMQSRSEAIRQLVSEGLLTDALEPEADDIDRELEQMHRRQAIEAELSQLKAAAAQ